MDGCHNVSASTNLGCRRCKSFGRLTNNSTECHAKDYGDDCSSDPVQSTNHEGGWPLLVGAHPRCPSIRPSRVFVAGNNRHNPLEREAGQLPYSRETESQYGKRLTPTQFIFSSTAKKTAPIWVALRWRGTGLAQRTLSV